jgi:hypothetical protein
VHPSLLTQDLPPISSDHPTSFDLHFEPNTKLIVEVRNFVTGFYRDVLHDADSGGRIAMATHELLENTVKYSSDGVTHLMIAVTTHPQGLHLTIRTRNRTVDEHLANVRRLLEQLNASASAFAYFQHLLAHSSRMETDSAGLGLARIAAECDMTLRCEIVGDELTITAEAMLPVPRPAPGSERVPS